MTALNNPAKEYMALPMTTSDGTEWKPVDYPGVADGYEISLYGEVRSPRRGLLKPQWRSGELVVALRMKDSPNSTTVRVDRLVLSVFDHYAPHLWPEHRDKDSQNCQLSNLRWREPTEREQRSLRSAASRRANDAHRGGRRRMASKSRVSATPAAAPPQPTAGSELEMLRTYRLSGVEVTVNAAGEIPAKGLPQGKLTPAKVAALAKILNAAVEMNRFMGVSSG